MSNGIGEHPSAEEYNLAVELLNANNITRAYEVVSGLLTSTSDFFQAHDLLGLIRYYQGDLESAEEEFNKALTLNPDFKSAQDHIKFLQNVRRELECNNQNKETLYATWYKEIPNWGDALNKTLLEEISGKQVCWAAPYDYRFSTKYIVIGSILHFSDAHSVVWGAGAISKQRLFSIPPKRICAVRGPLTRQLLINSGLQCPEVYGDPALLYPRFYNPQIEATHDLGIIAHFVDQDNAWIEYAREQGAKIIDILGSLNKVVDDIMSCKRIASSSLHGLIAADAYDRPSTWIEFSNKVDGGGFKFRDYFQSVNRRDTKPLRITKETQLVEVLDSFIDYKIDIDLKKLLECCPFPSSDI